MPDYLDYIKPAHQDRLRQLLNEIETRLGQDKKGFTRHRTPFESVRHLRTSCLDLGGDVVTIGRREDLSDKEHQQVQAVLHGFMPWRKGPFNIFGIEIDAEWRSERKWNRVTPHLPDLRGKVIADIGCNNGYYMFRMAHHHPQLVIGFEPYPQHYYTFKTLNSFAGQKNLRIELLGVEQLGLYEDFFDVVFLMGILYHRSAPVDVLRDVKNALRPGGTVIVESQGIPGDEPKAVFPGKTYAKVPGVYFVPTATCLKNWMTRTGFRDVSIFFSHPMTSEEQRRTAWMDFESYADFLDPADPTRTHEGYPAPIRVFLKGTS